MDKNYKIQETRRRVFARDGWRCAVCGRRLSHEKAAPQLAHKIPNRKMYLKKYGKEIIHHDLNLVAVCNLKCNAAVDIGYNEFAAEKIAAEIRENMI